MAVARAQAKTTKPTNANALPQPTAISPNLCVPNVREAAQFYGRLGFRTVMNMPGPKNDWTYAILQYKDTQLHLAPLASPNPPDPNRMRTIQKGPRGLGVILYTYCDDVDDVHNLAKSAGLQITAAPKDEFWGDRVFNCVDPYGYEWSFAQHVRDVTPGEMAKALETGGAWEPKA